ncbi:ROK family transcriptional regulator [Selenomonas caprae]|uniref:ROK family transcriptional regulator n=1 Tax=Selenomonas caprae TaxID=2606905 RepID=A0A5D6WLG5_9FIRM|nr:ROK family protein [Selenomonas caprae]TYZ29421.1 ROK family transcriptional regulator [Selenomonas caprae]
MDKKDLRKHNLQKVRQALRALKQATKPQLAERTGLSAMTVNTLVKLLQEGGEVELLEDFRPSASEEGGRPARQYRYLADRRLALTLCFYEEAGENQMEVNIENLLGDTVFAERVACPEVSPAYLLATIRRYQGQYPQLALVMMGLPGVEVDGMMAVVDYPALKGVRLREQLEASTGLPVCLVNDINAAVSGYGMTLGQAARQETVVGIYWPRNYPPGAGILLNGELYKGRDGLAGEISCLFDRGQYQPAAISAAQVAEKIVSFVRFWNPHGMVLYLEGIAPEQEAEIRKLCVASLPERFLPELILGRQLREDYRRGIHALAGAYLEKCERNGAKV